LRVSENRLLRRVFDPEREGITKEYKNVLFTKCY
jgi:hypothetical protein